MPVAAATTRTEPAAGTRIRAALSAGRHQLRASTGVLRAQRLHGPDDRVRVALVGQTALLLGGDEVDLDIEVGSGARLEVVEVAGTVAYHGRGRPAGWRTRIRVAEGGRLEWWGEPFVLSDGAEVVRTLQVDLEGDATVVLRETLVFGRSGERGGGLDAGTVLRRDGVEFCRERFRTDAADRARPGVLAGAKRMDTTWALGATTPAEPDTQLFRLLDPGSTLTRRLTLLPETGRVRQ